MYRDVLRMELGDFDAVRARRPVRVPVVMTVDEARQLLDGLSRLETTEPYHLMAQLMYGSGLRRRRACAARWRWRGDVARRAYAATPA